MRIPKRFLNFCIIKFKKTKGGYVHPPSRYLNTMMIIFYRYSDSELQHDDQFINLNFYNF